MTVHWPRVTTPPGWYPDPYHRFEFRYHNGSAWTRDVSVGGRRFVDDEGGRQAKPSRRATTALVFGIISVSIALLPVFVVVGIGFAIAAIGLGVGVGRDDRSPDPTAHPRIHDTGDRRFARAGVILGGVGLLLSVLGLWFTVMTYRAVDRYVNPAPHTVDIERCEVVDGVATVAGTITNLADDDSSFTVRIDIDDADTGRRLTDVSVGVDDVRPSEAGPIVAERPLRDGTIDCDVTRVDGPLPFGFDLG